MKLLKSTVIAMMSGVFIFNLFGLPFVDSQTRVSILSVILMSCCMGLLSQIYETNLALLPASLIHIVGSLCAFLIAAYLANWFPFKLGIFLTAGLLFIVIFMVIWTAYYFHEKKKISLINKQLK